MTPRRRGSRDRAAEARPGPPRVPGYRLGPPLGFGAHGPVWSGTATGLPAGGGTPVALTVLPRLADPSRAAARRRRLEALPPLRDANLLRTLDVVRLPDGQDVVVTERVDGPALGALRASRAPLTPPETAGVLRGLSRALEVMHAAGVIHGDVSPANVLVRADGSPVLLDLAGEAGFETGTEGFRPPEIEHGGPASPAGDVWSAAATALWMAPADDRAALESLLAPALDAHPAARCGPGHLAVLAGRIGEPRGITTPAVAALAGGAVRAGAAIEPTRVAGRRTRRGAARPRTPRPGRERAIRSAATPARGAPRRPRGRIRAVAALVSGVLAGAVIAALTVSGGSRPVPPAPEALSASAPGVGTASEDGREEVIDQVKDLLVARDQAIMRAAGADLAGVTVPGSPAADADARVLAALESSGTRVTGLLTHVEAVDVRRLEPATAEVSVVTTQRSYVRRTGIGDEVVPQQPARCVLLELDLLDGRWRVRQTAECPEPTG